MKTNRDLEISRLTVVVVVRIGEATGVSFYVHWELVSKTVKALYIP